VRTGTNNSLCDIGGSVSTVAGDRETGYENGEGAAARFIDPTMW
jgi:hypothetical protein